MGALKKIKIPKEETRAVINKSIHHFVKLLYASSPRSLAWSTVLYQESILDITIEKGARRSRTGVTSYWKIAHVRSGDGVEAEAQLFMKGVQLATHLFEDFLQDPTLRWKFFPLWILRVGGDDVLRPTMPGCTWKLLPVLPGSGWTWNCWFT